MKKALCIIICLILLLCCAGCAKNDDSIALSSGTYYAVGDFEEMLTPYLGLDTENSTFMLGAGSCISYAEYGAYEISDGKLIAASQSTIYTFEIRNSKTLVLTDIGDNEYFKLPIDLQFVCSEDLK